MSGGIDFFEDLSQDAAPPATLERLVTLADEATNLAAEIDAEQAALNNKIDHLKKIKRDLIPGIMEELALADFKMVDGRKITVSEKINASIPEEKRPAAFDWLASVECDGIIKTKVGAEFGKGEIDDANKAYKALIEAGVNASMDRNIHPMTLNAFVKERLENGEAIPLDIFSVFEFKEAKIAAPPKPRAKR